MKKDLKRFSFSKKIGYFGKVNVHVDKEKKIIVVEDNRGQKVIGMAKCAPSDEFSVTVGTNLALYRFLKKLKGIIIESEKRDIMRTENLFKQLIDSALTKANYVPHQH